MVKLLFLILLFFPPRFLNALDCQHTETNFHCVTFLSNYDGDTFRVNIPNVHYLLGHAAAIRLNGVDTPELHTKDPCEKAKGLEAKKLVKQTLSTGKVIHLLNCVRGKYFRLVCDTTVDGAQLKDKLVAARLAVPYDGGTKTKVDWCTFGTTTKTLPEPTAENLPY